jgi:signal transduction histidine kinase
VYAICGIGTDITSHKLAQKEITDSRAQLKALIQNSSDSIWSVNKDLKLTHFNTSCVAMMDKFYGSHLHKNMDVREMSDNESYSEWEECYRIALNGECFSREMKLVYSIEDHYYDVSFNPVIVNDNVVGVAVFARDITLRKGTEKQLSYKVNELNTFMYKATHDLRSPLVSLMGLVQLAEGEAGADAPELANYFDMIGKSVAKMDKLLVDLVSITSVSQGKLTVNKVDFHKIISDITDSLRHYPNFESITIRKMINGDAPFYNDDKLLYSVLQNLIDNAIKYRRSGNSANSLISIIVECSAQSVAINIIDNGIGISERSQEKVFDMFYRASNVSSGTGLGLYIVKTAVEKMKGKISLASKESEGTSIYITLPNIREETL